MYVRIYVHPLIYIEDYMYRVAMFLHPIPSHPIPSHPIPSHPIPSRLPAHHGGALVVHHLLIERVAHQHGIHPLLQLLLAREGLHIHTYIHTIHIHSLARESRAEMNAPAHAMWMSRPDPTP